VRRLCGLCCRGLSVFLRAVFALTARKKKEERIKKRKATRSGVIKARSIACRGSTTAIHFSITLHEQRLSTCANSNLACFYFTFSPRCVWSRAWHLRLILCLRFPSFLSGIFSCMASFIPTTSDHFSPKFSLFAFSFQALSKYSPPFHRSFFPPTFLDIEIHDTHTTKN
jgi:hypothetical protein